MSKKQKEIDALFKEQDDYEIYKLKTELSNTKRSVSDLQKALQKAGRLWSSSYKPAPTSKKKKSSGKYITRVVFGDLHGANQDSEAFNALLNDLALLNPDEIVILGDWIDCSGTFSKWHRVHIAEFSYNYETDIAAGNDALDKVQKAAPNAKIYFMQGNHEYRVDKWAAASFEEKYLAELAVSAFGACNALHLKKRGIVFFENNRCHMGMKKPGIIMLGKCGFLHGYAGGKHVSSKYLADLAINSIHGHNHREQSYTVRTARDSALKAACPGCLCILQPYYQHQAPTDHTHGYALQFEDRKSKWFSTSNIAIINGKSLLHFVSIK